ncbi:MAG: NADH-quinone oxidoreductase subunit M [Trueperaceae bacterium]|nr:MAG: NADH-quinone oxidoreductase subunit M [Trueperaceae bacterium]
MTLTVILIPLITALFLFFSEAADPLVRRFLGLLGTVSTFLVALYLPGTPGMSSLWLPGVNVYFALSPDGASAVLVLVASLVMIPTALYASGRVERRTGSFLALLLIMQAGLNGIFLAKDLILFYLFWELTLIPSLMMLGIWGGTKRRQAVQKYLIYAVTGSFLMLVGMLALRPLSGAASYRLEDLLAVTPALPAGTQLWIFLLFTLAFAVKLPLWPLHSWLPDFHEQNHPSGVADVAGTLYKVGGWGFFAWALPLLPGAAAVVAPVLLVLAAFTAVYAAVIATSQTNLKRLLAYASLSHMGLVGVGLFGLHLTGLSGAIYLLAAQMVSTGGLFLLSGMLYERRKTFELSEYGGLSRSAPALAAVTLFVLFTSIGVPGLANFPGEFMSLLGAFHASPWLAALATLSVIAAGVYGVNLYQRLYQDRETQPVADLRELELAVLVPILAGILWLGLAPGPQLERIEVQTRIIAQTVQPGEEIPMVTLGGRP